MEGYPIGAVQQFFSEYRSLRDLAKAHTCSANLMEPLLARLGVPPLIAGKGHTRLYAIADLPHAQLLGADVAQAKARNARTRKKKQASLPNE